MVKTRKAILLAIILYWGLAAPSIALSAGELKPEARELFDRGMAAVEQQEWLVAIGYFERARQVDEYAPQILMNLGLAESKLPGRELRSLAWFRAYLAAHPGAQNADAVRQECTRLEIKVEASVRKLSEDAKRFIPQMKGSGPETQPGRRLNSARSVVYAKLAEGLALLGDFTGARQMALLVEDPSDLEGSYGCKNQGEPAWCVENSVGARDRVFARIAAEQAEAKDTAGALDTLGMLKRKPAPGQWVESGVFAAYKTLAVAQAQTGDFAGAQKTIEAIPEKSALGKSEPLERKFGLQEISRIKEGGPRKPKADPSFLTSMFTGKEKMLFLRGPDLRKELYTNPAGHLKNIAARQKTEEIVRGYVAMIKEMALALKVIRIGDPMIFGDFK